jgi:HEAT repeat protein
MKCQIILSTLLLLVGSLGIAEEAEETEPRYRGKTSGQWIAILEEGELAARRLAAYALWSLAPDVPGAGPVLARGLRTDDKYLRETLAKAIQKLGPRISEAVPLVAEALGDERAEVRREAAAILYHSGPACAPALDALVKALEDPESVVRANVAGALMRLGQAVEGATKAAVPGLIGNIGHEDAEVRKWAAYALAVAEPAALVKPLLAELESEDVLRRVEAAGRFAIAGDTAKSVVPTLTALLADDDPRMRRSAVSALGVLAAAESVPHLIGLLKDVDKLVRASTCEAIARAGEAARPAIGALCATLGDEDSHVRSWACQALQSLGKASIPALTELLAATKHKNSTTRVFALQAVARIAPRDERVVARLSEAIEDENGLVRATAVSRLSYSGPAAAPAVPALLTFLEKNKDPGSIREAVRTLAQIGPAAAPAGPVLEGIMRAEAGQIPADIGLLAAKGLVLIGAKRAKGGLDQLAAALEEPGLAGTAVTYLAELGPSARGAAPSLRRLLARGGVLAPMTAAALVEILGPADAADALSALAEMLTKEGLPPRRAQQAAICLWRLGPAAAASVPSLVEALGSSYPILVRFVAQALGAIGSAAKTALPALLKLADHDDPLVRRAVAEATKNLQRE